MGVTSNNVTNNQAFLNTDVTKIFILNNRYQSADFDRVNATYDDITIPAGTVMGKISATGKVVPLTSGASDGSQYPIGILAEDITKVAGVNDTIEVTFCVSGDVNINMIDLQGSDTLNTVISGRSIHDRIGGDTVGVNLVPSTEMTSFDNS